MSNKALLDVMERALNEELTKRGTRRRITEGGVT